jgi:hypothetical protein
MREGARAVDDGQGLNVLPRPALSSPRRSQRQLHLPRSSPSPGAGSRQIPADSSGVGRHRCWRKGKEEGRQLAGQVEGVDFWVSPDLSGISG